MHMTIHDIQEALRSGKASCTSLVKEAISKAKKEQEELGLHITICEEEALASAKEVDARIAEGKELRPLEGVPFSAKDILCTKGIESTGASKILKGFVPMYDATVIAKVKEAGAILIAKNNCDEFAQGGSNEHSAYGAAKNPIDPSRMTGGSSGGSAAAVKAGSSVFTIGTDTGGSIRQPAAYCGVVGLKVTYGRTSRFGSMAMASSFDTVGPIANTVTDVAAVLSTIAGQDPSDPTTLNDTPPDYVAALKTPATFTIGVPKEYMSDDVDPAIKEALEKQIAMLKEQGHTIKEVSLPSTKLALSAYYILVPAEVSSNMSRYDGIRFGPKGDSESLDQIYVNNRTEGFGKEVQRRILLGTYVLSHGYYDAYYKKALKLRTKIIEEFNAVFKEVDLLIGPVTAGFAPTSGSYADPMAEYLDDIFTIPAACAGLPGLSLPIGEHEGLPIAMQIIGPQLSEEQLLQLGYLIESA